MRNFTGSLGVVFLLSQISCRTSDAENNLTSGPAAVKINLLGTEFANSKGTKPTASVGRQGLDLGSSGIQSKSIMINPSTFIIARLAPVNESLSPQASVGKNLSAAVPGDPLGSGIKFRVIAYDQGSGQYKTHQDYTVGQPAAPLMLDGGTAYNMVAYSYGNSTLPAISSGETTDLNSAVVNYDDNNRDFMYQNISYTPANAQNTLDITLRHKVAKITTFIISNMPGNGITAITNAAITPHATNGTIPLASGNITGRTNAASAAIDFSFLSTEATSITAAPIFVNADTGGAVTASFSANAIVGGNPRTINVPNALSITPGNTQSFTLNLTHCGAYIAPGVWKEFMCHNLGADYSADPFAPSQAIRGAKYQWGVLTNATRDLAGSPKKQYLSQAEDLTSHQLLTANPEWYPANRETLNTIPSLPWDTAWNDNIKTDQDPCPSGYKVPSKEQWQGVIDNNPISSIGTWSPDYTASNSGFLFGKGLFLIAAGQRYQTGGIQLTKAFDGSPNNINGVYWSSSNIVEQTPPLVLGLYTHHAYAITIGNNTQEVNTQEVRKLIYTYGNSVRCIKVD
ncbi:hypothetical protein BAY12_16275 [Elizabethkingia bruuniana]|nr:hypothetical protein BAY12_16275 [Elizabethkingia bruuniana]